MSNPTQGHRIELVRPEQTVTVLIDGVQVAKSSRPLALFETGLPVRYYLPPEDVDLTLFQPSATHTTCPFKGEASYWSFADRADVAWYYPEPIDSVAAIAGYLCFYDTVAKVRVEGELPER
ncbi:DUF427 domain-containing protein [Kitasatospora sp. NPDC101801]|uniref:DUF427 domain-containing protein n=1 Tax=Kitasatospora sp. NPDC101801 TaxID=3364103 RepID=UPI00382E1089